MALVEHTIAPAPRDDAALLRPDVDVAHQNAMVSARILAILAIVLPQICGMHGRTHETSPAWFFECLMVGRKARMPSDRAVVIADACRMCLQSKGPL